MSVLSVSLSTSHEFQKHPVSSIKLLEDGIEGDCHRGTTVQHRSRLHIRPSPPNLRQVHLMHSELFEEFLDAGYSVSPGQLGENVTTLGVDLLALGRGTLLHFLCNGKELTDDHAVVRLAGLRNPCRQIDKFQSGLREKCLLRDGDRNVMGRKAGVMGTVEATGIIETGAIIVVDAPSEFVSMDCV